MKPRALGYLLLATLVAIACGDGGDGDYDENEDASSGEEGEGGDTETATPDGGPAPAYALRVQPIHVAMDDGTDPANPDEHVLEAETTKIWAQAGVQVSWYPWVTWSKSEVWDGFWTDEVNGYDFRDVLLTGPVHEDPTVVNLFFVKNIDPEGHIGGLSLVGQRLAMIAEWIYEHGAKHVIAHELGHNLGLQHEDFGALEDPNNLMNGPEPFSIDDIYPDGEQLSHLTEDQISHVLASPFTPPLDGTSKAEQRSIPTLPVLADQ